MIACADKYSQVAEAFGEGVTGISKWAAAEKAVCAVRRLVRDIGLPQTLSVMGLSASALKDACIVTNPRDAGIEDIADIYRKAL